MNIRSLIQKSLTCLLLTGVSVQMAKAQYVYKIKADTVRIYNTCDTAELVLQNRTQNVLGYLYNKGGGVTEFRTLGTVDTVYRSNDTLFYHTIDGRTVPVKMDLTAINDTRYDLKSTNYVTVNANDSANYGKIPVQKVVGVGAYNATDMPPLSNQAFQNPGSKLYYQGFAVSDGSRAVNMMVNWDGELKGPNGAFLRTKDDTKSTWSAWRELVFKDYADTAYSGHQGLASDTANIYNHDGVLTSNRYLHGDNTKSFSIDSVSFLSFLDKNLNGLQVGAHNTHLISDLSLMVNVGSTGIVIIPGNYQLTDASMQNADTNKVLTVNPSGYLRLKSLPAGGGFISNSATYQTAAVYNVDRGLINQAAQPATSTGTGVDAPYAFRIIGGQGGNSSSSGAFPVAGKGADISMLAGFGGVLNGSPTGGLAGPGGNASFVAGDGGAATGSGILSGAGGNMAIQGGNAGLALAGSTSGVAGYLKLSAGNANAGSANGDGASVFIIAGAKAGGGTPGDVLLNTSPTFTSRGRVLVGYTAAGIDVPTQQVFQVKGTSLFSDTVTMANTPALATPAINLLTSNNGVIQTRTAAQVLADIGAAPWYDYVSRTAQPANPPGVPPYTGDLNSVLNNTVALIDQTAANNPAGRAGYLYAAGNNTWVTGAKYQIYGGTQNDDFWYRYGTDGGPWGAWYQAASRAWVAANFAPATAIRTITANYTASITDYTIVNKATAGTPVLTLPAASANIGRIYNIVDESANPTANGIVFSPVYYKGATYTSFNNPILSAYSRITVQSDGTDWIVISSM